MQLTGKTVGLVGFGGIAAEMARLCRGAGMTVLAWNRTPKSAEGVEFVDRGLFRAEVKLPTVAPTGKYYAEVWLFQDGEPQSVSNLTLTVEKVGLERDIYEFAHRRPWLYGVLCVVLAALTGYGASRVFSRRS